VKREGIRCPPPVFLKTTRTYKKANDGMKKKRRNGRETNKKNLPVDKREKVEGKGGQNY